MTINLIIESAPTPQARMSFTYEFGQLVIGRGADADWQLDDPERYLSRSHCILAMAADQMTATDASRGGTFVDGSETPLGTGNSVVLEDGMRLRMGDFVFRVDMAADITADTPQSGSPPHAPSPFDFGESSEVPTQAAPERPDNLPHPFDPYVREEPSKEIKEKAPTAPKPFGMDDPFALDLPKQKAENTSASSSSYFDQPLTPLQSEVVNEEVDEKIEDVVPLAQSIEVNGATPSVLSQDSQVLEALLKGMGIAQDAAAADPIAQATEIGQQYRLLVDGVMQLLRARASAKQQVRAAQTLISSADVNPLKFLATVDDALDIMISGDRPGYQSAPDAIVGAYRDLADHQLRTWRALQSALRRMIDQFDPEQIESEIAETGVLESLLAGGKSAQLWQTYEEKYKDIARAAEDRFLGEIGDKFRDAYEGNEKETSK